MKLWEFLKPSKLAGFLSRSSHAAKPVATPVPGPAALKNSAQTEAARQATHRQKQEELKRAKLRESLRQKITIVNQTPSKLDQAFDDMLADARKARAAQKLKEQQEHKPKRAEGYGTAYMGGAHIEVQKGHVSQHPDKDLIDAWAREARRQNKVDKARAEEQARKQAAHTSDIDTPQAAPEQTR